MGLASYKHSLTSLNFRICKLTEWNPEETFNRIVRADLTGVAFLESTEFERFSMYKFSIDYPPVCSIQFDPKGKRTVGDMLFLFPGKEKIYLTWGELEKAKMKFPNASDQAIHSIGVMKKIRTIKRLETISEDLLTINSHQAAYRQIRLEEMAGGILPNGRTILHEGYSIHLHCDQSSRYFAIYTIVSSKSPEDFGELFRLMVNSFRCH